MTDDSRKDGNPRRRPLVVNAHRKRSIYTWLVPLVIILAIMYLLPRVSAWLD